MKSKVESEIAGDMRVSGNCLVLLVLCNDDALHASSFMRGIG